MTIAHPFASNDFSTMDDDALAAAVSTLAAHIHAATYRLLVLIAELDRREVWAAQGALSCAHWLSWACGIDTHTAREKVRVARALTDLPLLSEALAKGELGYSKVRALTRIATSENEVDLLNIGLHGTAQHVEKFVRLHRRAKRAEETERADAQHENRGLTFWHDDDGTVVLHGRFPPEMGARILSALDAAMAAHAEEQPAAGWDNEDLAPEDVPRGTSRQDPSAADASTDAGARERAAAHRREDAQVFLTDVPRGTFIRGPSRTVRRADALGWMAERMFESGDAPALAPVRKVHDDAYPVQRVETLLRRDIARQSRLAIPVDDRKHREASEEEHDADTRHRERIDSARGTHEREQYRRRNARGAHRHVVDGKHLADELAAGFRAELDEHERRIDEREEHHPAEYDGCRGEGGCVDDCGNHCSITCRGSAACG